jgi:hypothetical protein
MHILSHQTSRASRNALVSVGVFKSLPLVLTVKCCAIHRYKISLKPYGSHLDAMARGFIISATSWRGGWLLMVVCIDATDC